MVEFIFGFGAGYFLHKVITAIVSTPHYDMLLKWDRDILSWRAVVPGTMLNPMDRYIAAIEVEPEHVEALSATMEDDGSYP